MNAFLEHRLPINGHSAIMNRQMVLDLGDVSELKSHIDGFWITALAIQRGSFYTSEVVVISREGLDNYSASSYQNLYKRYALFEIRIKKIISRDEIKHKNLWKEWRENIKNHRLRNILDIEKITFEKFKEISNQIPNSIKHNFGPELLRVLQCFENPEPLIQKDLLHINQECIQIFNDIAGPLEEEEISNV